MKMGRTMRTERKNAIKTVKAPAVLIITLIFTFTSFFTFTACGGNDSGSGAGAAGRINSPCETLYLTSNKLEFETINTLADGTEKPEDYPSAWEYLYELTPEQQAEYDFNNLAFQGSYVQISGLKDKDVETAVNEKIKNLYMENLERIPPYRGIMAKLGKNPELYINDFSFPTMSLYETMSCNNILSIVLNVNRQYVDTTETEGNGNIIYLSYMETLNIDLNTGEEVPIEALFCDDIDGLAYMSEYTKDTISSGSYDSEEYYYFDAPLRLTGQFDGIKETQKYYLTQNGIFLIFDYEVPELSGDFSVQSIIIPYTDEMAVTERFFEKDKNIYESDEEPVKSLMMGNYVDDIPLDEYSNNIQDENITFSRYVTANVGTPQVIKERLIELASFDEEEEAKKLHEVIEAYEAANGLTFENVDKGIYAMSTVDIAGKYITITNEMYRHISAYNSGSDAEDPYYYNDNVMTYEVYDMSKKITKDTKPLELTDIFTKNADYETLIKDGMRDALNSALRYVAENYEADNPGSKYEYFCEGEHTDLDKKFLDEVYKEISGFRISSTHLILALDDNKLQDVFKNVYGYDSDYVPDGYSFGQYLYSMRSIPYENLGYENITIFD